MNGKKILVIVDMQNDFIDGVLGNDMTKVVLPKVVKKLREKGFPLHISRKHLQTECVLCYNYFWFSLLLGIGNHCRNGVLS